MLSVEIIAEFKHKSFTLVRATNKNRGEIVTLTRRQPTFEPQIKALQLTILNRNIHKNTPFRYNVALSLTYTQSEIFRACPISIKDLYVDFSAEN